MTSYSEITAYYSNGRSAVTTRTCSTRARTEAGIVAALHRTLGPTAVSMCGGTVERISAFDRRSGRTVEFSL